MLTQEQLKELLHYDPDTGVFTWIKQLGYSGKPGTVAGSLHSHGYWRIKIHRKAYKAHRLAWLYMTGEWPPEGIDHINRVRNDNRFCNLRLATHAENQQNRTLPKTNTSGYMGVHWDKEKKSWRAQIKVKSKKVSLGCYDSKEKASQAYLEAKAKYHTFSTSVPF